VILAVLLKCIFGNEIGLFGLGWPNNGLTLKSLGKKMAGQKKIFMCGLA
jgi:hypothetical protein